MSCRVTKARTGVAAVCDFGRVEEADELLDGHAERLQEAHVVEHLQRELRTQTERALWLSTCIHNGQTPAAARAGAVFARGLTRGRRTRSASD